MRYTGRAAMRLSALHHYHRGLWTLSGVLTIVASLAALWFTFHFREEKSDRLLKIISSVIVSFPANGNFPVEMSSPVTASTAS